MSDFIYLVQNLADAGFQNEFDRLENDIDVHDCEAALVDPSKNRFSNILAYDGSRVPLGTGYINASYIANAAGVRTAYIATQWPLDETIKDFWRMVFEQQSSVIVMLSDCNVFEGVERRYKRVQYWLDLGVDDTNVGNIRVQLAGVDIYVGYLMRTLTLVCNSSTRTVRQFALAEWPDHGTPHNIAALTNMIHHIARFRRTTNVRPMVVHCNAGVGRSGTYIAIDRLFTAIKASFARGQGINTKLLDVYGTVADMRDNRPMMVQTIDQYKIIYTTLLAMIQTLFTNAHAGSLETEQATAYND